MEDTTIKDTHPNGTSNSSSTEIRIGQVSRRAQNAANAIAIASMTLLLVAAILSTYISYLGWDRYTAGIALFCAGVAGYPVIHLGIYVGSSQFFRRLWARLEAFERFEWAQRGPALFNAVAMTLAGAHVLFEVWRGQGSAKERTEAVSAYVGLDLGYLLQDLCGEIFKRHRFGSTSSTYLWLHHVALLLTLPWFVYKHYGDIYFGLFFFASASTVPAEAMWILRRAGLKRGPLYQALSAMYVLTFAACRIAIFPFLFWVYAHDRGWGIAEVPRHIPLVCTLSCLAMVGFNCAWLARYIAGGTRTHKPRGDASRKLD